MRVRFLRGTCLGGVGNDAAIGDVRELLDIQAKSLIAQKRAVLEVEAPAAPAHSGYHESDDPRIAAAATKPAPKKGK